MDYSECFRDFVNSFENANELEAWARQFEHIDEPIVRQRLEYLREFPPLRDYVSIPICLLLV